MKISALALVLIASAALAADEDPIENPRLPRLWKVASRTNLPAEQVAGLAKKLGVAMTSIENDVLDAGGVPLKINVARCPDEESAKALQAKFQVIHGNDELSAARRGADVAEIVCGNRFVARKARHLIGWDGPRASPWHLYYWRAALQVAPLERCDGMRWNKLFNLLCAPESPAKAAAVEEEAKAFVFADRLPDAKPDAPKAERVHGVPRVECAWEGVLERFETEPTSDDVSTWTAATAAWPSDAPEAKAAAKEALGDDARTSPRERAERVLGWVHAHVRYGGDEVGSRYGALKVMAQGRGHCWDQSDVFVTLCRAAGVRARQVGGWLYGGEGHVWAEIVVGEEDGRPAVLGVDPGTTWLGVSEDYVRLWTSNDGRTPFVYWAAPKIERFACIK